MSTRHIDGPPSPWLAQQIDRLLPSIEAAATEQPEPSTLMVSIQPATPGSREDRTCDRCGHYCPPNVETMHLGSYSLEGAPGTAMEGRNVIFGFGLCDTCAHHEYPQPASTLADAKARAARTHHRIGARPTVEQMPNSPHESVTAWKVRGDDANVVVMMPRLLPGAPASLRRRYRDRIIANATGTCPRCGEASGVEQHHADTTVPGSSGRLAHADNCPVLTRDTDNKWIDQTGIRMLATALMAGEPHDPDC